MTIAATQLSRETEEIFASEFETTEDGSGLVYLTLVLLRPNPMGGHQRIEIGRRIQMPKAGFDRSVEGGSLACVRRCSDRARPLSQRTITTKEQ